MSSGTPAPPSPPSCEGLFRYFVVGQVEALMRTGLAHGPAVREVAGRYHLRPDGRTVRVSARTIRRWRALLAGGGLGALEPRSRKRTEDSEVLPDKLLDFVREEKTQDPRASVPELLRRARERGVLDGQSRVSRTTLWRACKRMGLATRVRPSKHEGDTRRFSYPHRMQCVLCDGKYFRASIKRLRRVALFFLDDCTRMGLGVTVGTAESTELFLRGLHRVVETYGLMDMVFLDRGPGFISSDTVHVVTSGLGANLVHGKEAYPQGHGKIERFHQTATASVLRSFDKAVEVDPDCDALQLRLEHFLENDYNLRPHESLSLESPRRRFYADTKTLRFAADHHDLFKRFIVTDTRKVSADHVIRYGGKLFEAPRGLARQEVVVHRQVLSGQLFVVHRDRWMRLHELDPTHNATSRRGYPKDPEPLPGEGVPKTAATLAFEREFAPVTGPDGGFIPPTHDED